MLQYTTNNRKSTDYWNSQKSLKQNNEITNLKLSGSVVTQKKDDIVSKVIAIYRINYLYLYII